MLIHLLTYFFYVQIGLAKNTDNLQPVSIGPQLVRRTTIHPSYFDRAFIIRAILEQITRVAAAATYGADEINRSAFDHETFLHYFRIDNAQYRDLVRLRFYRILGLSSQVLNGVVLRCDDPRRLCIKRSRMNAHTVRNGSAGQAEIILCRRYFTDLDLIVAAPHMADDQVFVLLREFTHTSAVTVPPLRDFRELGLNRWAPERLWPQQAIESALMFELYAKTLFFRTRLEEEEI